MATLLVCDQPSLDGWPVIVGGSADRPVVVRLVSLPARRAGQRCDGPAGLTAAKSLPAKPKPRSDDAPATPALHSLLRTAPQAPSAAGGAAAGGASGGAAATATAPDDRAMHAQVGPILITAGQIVSARTVMSMDDAQKRVDDAINRDRASVTQAADTARKAGAYLSFWTFMSLLFGAACATLGGMRGGDLRDDFTTRRAVPTAPR